MDDTLFAHAKSVLLKGVGQTNYQALVLHREAIIVSFSLLMQALPTPPQSPRSVFTNMSDHVKQLWERLTAS